MYFQHVVVETMDTFDSKPTLKCHKYHALLTEPFGWVHFQDFLPDMSGGKIQLNFRI